jgi:hypothetical protein
MFIKIFLNVNNKTVPRSSHIFKKVTFETRNDLDKV